MNVNEKSKRKRERLELSLPVQVYCRETETFDWKEVTRLIDVTPFGAGFSLSHTTEVGRLLLLTMNLPRQLRCYDHLEAQYKVWALVRYVRPLAQEGDNPSRFMIGVAFIGKRPPSTHETDPTRRYEIAPSATETGMWGLVEMKAQSEHQNQLTGKLRPETRYTIQIMVKVEVLDDQANVVDTEETVTENVSHQGASIFSALNLEKGRFVRVTSLQQNITAMAVVRGLRIGKDSIPRLHVQFVDCHWPIEGVD